MFVFLYQEEPPTSCDNALPDISVDDVRLLQQMAPELMAELHIGDSLESSMFKVKKIHLFFEEKLKTRGFHIDSQLLVILIGSFYHSEVLKPY